MRRSLESAGYRMAAAQDIASALALVGLDEPHLILLDAALPGNSGYEGLCQIRLYSTSPLILIGCNSAESERVEGLKLGADDFVCKPFGMDELIARIRALLRRAEFPKKYQSSERFASGGIEIDFSTRWVAAHGKPVDLSRTEYKLLAELASHAGKVMLHSDLLSRVWGPDYKGELDYLRVYIRHLRLKLEKEPNEPRCILCKPGIGYLFALTASH
ncbi:MAG: response regulator transcription factor [Chloroflexi bacterium]|nr:response regulator transcription factor [Chloroflexota bacterium]